MSLKKKNSFDQNNQDKINSKKSKKSKKSDNNVFYLGEDGNWHREDDTVKQNLDGAEQFWLGYNNFLERLKQKEGGGSSSSSSSSEEEGEGKNSNSNSSSSSEEEDCSSSQSDSEEDPVGDLNLEDLGGFFIRPDSKKIEPLDKSKLTKNNFYDYMREILEGLIQYHPPLQNNHPFMTRFKVNNKKHDIIVDEEGRDKHKINILADKFGLTVYGTVIVVLNKYDSPY